MKILSLVVSILPHIIAIVNAVETAISVPKSGSQKLQLVLDVLAAAVPDIEQARDVITKVINAVVSCFNALGVFRHG